MKRHLATALVATCLVAPAIRANAAQCDSVPTASPTVTVNRHTETTLSVSGTCGTIKWKVREKTPYFNIVVRWYDHPGDSYTWNGGLRHDLTVWANGVRVLDYKAGR